MKAFLIGILVLVIMSAGAYVGLKYYYKPASGTQTFQTSVITKTGVLQKSTIAKSDFTHVLVSSGASVGVASYTLHLNDYIGKKVSVTGQFSGDTLYADSITVTQ